METNSLNTIMQCFELELAVKCFGEPKQPSRGVHRKRCSENMQHIYKITPMPKWDFNKDTKKLY